MRNISYFNSIKLCIKPVDFRKGIFGLSSYVEGEFNENVFSNTLFVFINKHKNSLKCLYWDKTGFALWQKVLDKDKFRWPKKVDAKIFTISKEELEWLLKGIDISKIKVHKELEYFFVN